MALWASKQKGGVGDGLQCYTDMTTRTPAVQERQHYSADWVTGSLNFSEVIWCFTIEGRGHDGAQTE